MFSDLEIRVRELEAELAQLRDDQTSQHQGWKNSETRRLWTWIGNNARAQADARDRAEAIRAGIDDRDDAIDALAEDLKEAWTEEAEGTNAHAHHADIFDDLLTAALARVDWPALADELISAVDNRPQADDDEEAPE